MDQSGEFTAFVGERAYAQGTLEQILTKLRSRFARYRGTVFLIFDHETGKQHDFDLREGKNDVPPSRGQAGPGRPKLGVVAREVTLLPRHWEWLEAQPKGASVTLRQLLDEAQKHESAESRKRRAIYAAGRFLSGIAGNYANYEEASRALYRGDLDGFEKLISSWPRDVRDCALSIAKRKT
jgi:hypothetical protein